MALSNIFREPRREITESAVGLAISIPAVWMDYEAAVWFQALTTNNQPGNEPCPWPLGMLAVIPVLAICAGGIAFGFLAVTHALGDAVCIALERRGLYLRPRQRY